MGWRRLFTAETISTLSSRWWKDLWAEKLRSWGCFRNCLEPQDDSIDPGSSLPHCILRKPFELRNHNWPGKSHNKTQSCLKNKVHLFRLVAEVVSESATHLTTLSPLHWPCPGTPCGTHKRLPRRKASLYQGTILPFNHLCKVVSRATSRWTPPWWWVCLPSSCTRWRWWWWCRSEDHVSMFHFKLSNNT